MSETEDYEKPSAAGPHKTTHQDGGSDEISVQGLAGVLPESQPSTWALISGKPSTFTPEAHKTSHQAAGSDEISVQGLAGELTAEQKSAWAKVSGKPSTFTPEAHHTSHEAPDGNDQPGPVYFTHNKQIIDRDYTLGPGYNSSVVGPITVADTKTLTILENCRLVVL